jgi:hypothetical protein
MPNRGPIHIPTEYPEVAIPRRIPTHHVPNVLPVNHKRDDYDFDYRDGTWGTIRLSAVNNCLVPIDLPAQIWCRRHGWEKEIVPNSDVFEVTDEKVGKGWGWRCPTCGRSRVDARFTSQGRAERSLDMHIDDKHQGIMPYRLHGARQSDG